MLLNYPNILYSTFNIKGFDIDVQYSIEEEVYNGSVIFFYRDSKGNRHELKLRQGFFHTTENSDPLQNELVFDSFNNMPTLSEGYSVNNHFGFGKFALVFLQENWYIPIEFIGNRKKLFIIENSSITEVNIDIIYKEFKVQYLEEEVKPEEVKPEEVKPEEVKPEEVKPEVTKNEKTGEYIVRYGNLKLVHTEASGIKFNTLSELDKSSDVWITLNTNDEKGKILFSALSNFKREEEIPEGYIKDIKEKIKMPGPGKK